VFVWKAFFSFKDYVNKILNTFKLLLFSFEKFLITILQ
jgi:hypothetical protein